MDRANTRQALMLAYGLWLAIVIVDVIALRSAFVDSADDDEIRQAECLTEDVPSTGKLLKIFGVAD